MKTTIDNAVITGSVAAVVAELQSKGGSADLYVRVLDSVMERILLDPDGDEYPGTLDELRALQQLKNDIKMLASVQEDEQPEDTI